MTFGGAVCAIRLTKVAAPVVGATKLHLIEGAARAVELALTTEELAWLEQPYVPHTLVGAMAQNTASSAKESHSGLQAIKKSSKKGELL